MAFTEQLHPRGTGALGGQFVASGAAAKKTTAPPAQKNARAARQRPAGGRGGGNLSFDGKRGTGYGTKGGDKRVKALQSALNRLGLTDSNGKKLVLDGKLGPRTTAAIKKAQRKLGLKADGVVTPKLLQQLTKAKKLEKPRKVPAPVKKGAPKPAPRTVAPVRSGKGGRKAAPVEMNVSRTIVRGMTDATRHATHNQKSHGNRLGRPTNAPGRTGLAKATAALADKPTLGPERAPARRDFSPAELRDILAEGRPAYMGVSRKNEDHLKILEKAGASPEQAREILKDLGGDPDRPWEVKDLGYTLQHRAQKAERDAAESDMREKLAMATPTAYARLLGDDGQPALIKSKPVIKVFESMRANGWKITATNGHGGYTFSSPDGNRKINVLAVNGVKIYDERHNPISGSKALARVEGT